METNVLLELAGLQTVQKLIAERIAQLQQQLPGATAGPRKATTDAMEILQRIPPAPAKKPVSQAKLDALAKARAAKVKKPAKKGARQ